MADQKIPEESKRSIILKVKKSRDALLDMSFHFKIDDGQSLRKVENPRSLGRVIYELISSKFLEEREVFESMIIKRNVDLIMEVEAKHKRLVDFSSTVGRSYPTMGSHDIVGRTFRIPDGATYTLNNPSLATCTLQIAEEVVRVDFRDGKSILVPFNQDLPVEDSSDDDI